MQSISQGNEFDRLRLNRLNNLELSSDRLPSPEELPVEESRIVIVPYLAKKKFDEAIKFL